MSYEASVEEQRADILRKLSFQAPLLAAINVRVERTGGLDASINRSKQMAVDYCNTLLDKYNVIGFTAIPTLEDNPGKEALVAGEPIDVRGLE